jgi:hypothetical protein
MYSNMCVNIPGSGLPDKHPFAQLIPCDLFKAHDWHAYPLG